MGTLTVYFSPLNRGTNLVIPARASATEQQTIFFNKGTQRRDGPSTNNLLVPTH